MQMLARFIGMLLVAGALGLGSALYLTSERGAQAQGPWRMWVSGVMPEQSLYALTHFSTHATLTPDINQMAIFTASSDSDGRRLDGDCVYVISGSLPPARWWSLSVRDDGSRLLSSGHVITGADGAFSAQVSRQAVPGNWLQLADDGAFELVLRFHGPTGLLKDDPERASLPAIRKGDCP